MFCLHLCFDFQISDSIHTSSRSLEEEGCDAQELHTRLESFLFFFFFSYRSLEEEGFDAQELHTRLEFLCTALQVDLTWQPGLVSDGQLRRSLLAMY